MTTPQEIFESTFQEIMKTPGYPHDSFVYEANNTPQALTCLVAGAECASTKTYPTLSKKGRVAILRMADLLGSVRVFLFPGEECEVTLFAGISVPKDPTTKEMFLAGTLQNYEWHYNCSQSDIVYVPIKKVSNVTPFNNTIRFFDSPIPFPRIFTLSLQVTGCRGDNSRFSHIPISIEVENIFVSDEIRKIIPSTNTTNFEYINNPKPTDHKIIAILKAYNANNTVCVK